MSNYTTDLLLDRLISLKPSLTIEAKQMAHSVLLDYIGVLAGVMKYLEDKCPDLI